jgi:hypothetical protein
LPIMRIYLPGCDVGIYKATVIPSVHPSDLELIVDSADWHEIMARAVVPYSAIHGIAAPPVIERADKRVTHPSLGLGTPFGLLGAASITDRETHPRDGIHFAGKDQFQLQGTDTIDYTDADLCGIRMLGVMPNRFSAGTTIYEIKNIAGERVSILGEIPIRNIDANGDPIIDPSGNIDTSFLLRMPANMPYLMQGIDCDGRTLNTDQTWQHLQPGEQKTCGGCHVHSKPSRITFAQSHAATPEYVIPQLGEGTVQLLTGEIGGVPQTRVVGGQGMQVEFARDILPIFETHCASCHSGATPAAGLTLNAPGTEANSTWWCLTSDIRQDCVPVEKQMTNGAGSGGLTFPRPQLTRYVRAFNSLGSLLYWKAANSRTDNRLDAAHTDDIDFGLAHPTTITPDELGLLSRWIDIGVPGGAEELRDTQKPTLNVRAVDSGTEVNELKIGTIDLGSGVNPLSFNLCIDDGVTCNNVPATITPNTITAVNLATPITDYSNEIVASVSDIQGNTTDLRWQVSFVLSQEAAPPPPPPAGLTIDVGLDESIEEGVTFSRAITFTDGEDLNADGWTYSVDWGNGSVTTGAIAAASTSFTISNGVLAAPAVNSVTVTITDDLSDTATGSFNLTVTTPPPPPLPASADLKGLTECQIGQAKIVTVDGILTCVNVAQ